MVEAWYPIDIDKNGEVTFEEIRKNFPRRLFNRLDINKNGVIDYEEFLLLGKPIVNLW